MIDETVFRTEWAILSERFGKKFSAPVTARYFRYLTQRMDTNQFRTACAVVFSSNEFFPIPENFIQCVAASDDAEALNQWELCERIMEGERDILDRMSETGKRVVGLLGGVGRLGQTEIGKVAFVRRDFLRFYADTLDGDPSALLPEVTDKSREIAGEVFRQLPPGDTR